MPLNEALKHALVLARRAAAGSKYLVVEQDMGFKVLPAVCTRGLNIVAMFTQLGDEIEIAL